MSLYNEDRSWCGVATGAHVIEEADKWQKPIKIRHEESGEVAFLKADQRAIHIDWDTDSAVIIFFRGSIDFPENPIPLNPLGNSLGIGSEVGWMGFPNIQQYTLCFFSGNVSARQEFRNAYLINGVSIHGVSGGPVLHKHETDGVQIVGIVSAYHANRATGESLPGLLIAQDVSHFQGVLRHVRSADDANKKKRELEEAQKAIEANA